jgi:integrase
MRGHIRQRTQDTWSVIVSQGFDPQTGRRRRLWRTVRGTRRDAERVLTELLHAHDYGIDTPPGRITLAEYLTRWIATYAVPNTSPTTARRYEQLLRLHVVPNIGNIQLTRLRPLHIEQAYTRAREGVLSPRTLLQVHRVLREALQHAVRLQLLARNPADAVQAPRPDRFQAPMLDLDDIARLLDAADDTHFGDVVYMALMSGMRLGELLGLRWHDVDLDTGVLSVRQTCHWLPREGYLFRQPKSIRSVRPVALSPAAVDRLRQHRVKQVEERLAAGPAYATYDLVFADALGGPMARWNLRKAWQRILRTAGLAGIRFHDLRHAHASLLLREGVHPKIVSERLGHSTVAITLDLYSHVAPSLQAQAAAKLDRLIRR